MVYEILWSSKAQNDLEQIYAYYSARSRNAANKVIADMHTKINYLSSHPKMAAIETQLEDNPKIYRSLVVANGNYKVIYCIDEKNIYISRIWACRQDPETLRSII